jgi:probable rRNA maturation factor
MNEIMLRNRQQVRPVNRRLLHQIIHALVTELLGYRQFELGIHLVNAMEMRRLNESFLHQAGPTDVIAFNHNLLLRNPVFHFADGPISKTQSLLPQLHGEVFVCLDMAVAQARQFHTSWQAELVRYITHGLLHLQGYDDVQPSARRRMKREEKRLLDALAARFSLENLDRG